MINSQTVFVVVRPFGSQNRSVPGTKSEYALRSVRVFRGVTFPGAPIFFLTEKLSPKEPPTH